MAELPDLPVPRRRCRPSLARRTAQALGQALQDVLQNEALAAQPGLLQRLDPRAKLLSLLLCAVTASLVHSVPLLLVLVGGTVFLAAASRAPVASFLRKVWGSAGLYALLVAAPAMTSWVLPGPALVTLGPVVLTVPGVTAAGTLVCRVVAGAGFALLVVWTTRWVDLMAALSALRVPEIVVATLAMTHQQILGLLRTTQQMHLARESRTLGPATVRQERSWVTGRVAFVVQRAVRTAEDVYDAMLARGYTGRMHSARRPRLRWRDAGWLAAAVLVCGALVAADRGVLRP